MGLSSFIRRLLPQENKYFELFRRNVINLQEASVNLRRLLDATNEADRRLLISEIEDAEHRGDDISHEIFDELSKTFITPIDREDIHALASEIDDILDLIEDVAVRTRLYGVLTFPNEFRELTDMLNRAVDDLAVAIPLLHDMSNAPAILKACEHVNTCENVGDEIYHNTIAFLFKQYTDPIELIKYKEILSDIENAIDSCEHVANLIEGVVVKYA